MNWKVAVLVCVVLMLVVAAGAGALYLHLTRASSNQDDKLEALKELRDTGAITQQDYDARVQSIQASTQASATTPSQSSTAVSSIKAAFAGKRKVEVTDAQYQMTAYTMEIPGDWKFAGEITRPPGCHGNGASLRFTAESQDGLTASVYLPGVSWSWSANEMRLKSMEAAKCPGIGINTAAGFLLNIAVPNIRPSAKIIAVLPLPPEGQARIAEQSAKAQEQNAAIARQSGRPPRKVTIDGARVRVQYDRDGHPVEEMIVAVIQCNESTMPGGPQQPAYQQRTCNSRGTTITRAPQGHLDEVLASAPFQDLGKSVQPSAEWMSRLSADQQAAFQKFEAENNRQFQQFMANNRAQNDQMLANGRAFNAQLRASTDAALAADRQKQAAIDASAHKWALYALDKQEFTNPNTGQTVEASSMYYHQWMSSDGSTLIQTDDHTFDPNGVVYPVSQSWTELIPKQ